MAIPRLQCTSSHRPDRHVIITVPTPSTHTPQPPQLGLLSLHPHHTPYHLHNLSVSPTTSPHTPSTTQPDLLSLHPPHITLASPHPGLLSLPPSMTFLYHRHENLIIFFFLEVMISWQEACVHCWSWSIMWCRETLHIFSEAFNTAVSESLSLSLSAYCYLIKIFYSKWILTWMKTLFLLTLIQMQSHLAA